MSTEYKRLACHVCSASVLILPNEPIQGRPLCLICKSLTQRVENGSRETNQGRGSGNDRVQNRGRGQGQSRGQGRGRGSEKTRGPNRSSPSPSNPNPIRDLPIVPPLNTPEEIEAWRQERKRQYLIKILGKPPAPSEPKPSTETSTTETPSTKMKSEPETAFACTSTDDARDKKKYKKDHLPDTPTRLILTDMETQMLVSMISYLISQLR